jgi:hypothetical protein
MGVAGFWLAAACGSEKPEGSAASCVLNTDCPKTEVCMAGRCVLECRTDRDCADDERCVTKPNGNQGCVAVSAGAGGSSGSGTGTGGNATGGAGGNAFGGSGGSTAGVGAGGASIGVGGAAGSAGAAHLGGSSGRGGVGGRSGGSGGTSQPEAGAAGAGADAGNGESGAAGATAGPCVIEDTASFYAGVTEDAGGSFLELEIRVSSDPTGDHDVLYVGVWDDSSHSGNVLRLEKQIGVATSAEGLSYTDLAYTGTRYVRTSSQNNTWGLNNVGGFTVPPLPGWLKTDARIIVACPQGDCTEWSVRLRMPVDANADVTADDPTGVKITSGGAYRLWYQVQESASINMSVFQGFPTGLPVAEDSMSATCDTIIPYCFPDPTDATNPWLRIAECPTL